MDNNITRFDRATCKKWDALVLATLQQLAKDHGLTVQPAGGSFGDTDYTGRYRFKVDNADTQTQQRYADDWRQLASTYQLPADAVGRTITINRKTFTIQGLDLNTRSRNIGVITDASGRTFRTDLSTLKGAL